MRQLTDVANVGYVGGFGSGKTEDLAYESMYQCLAYPDNYGCLASATYPQLNRSTIKKVFEFYAKMGLKEGIHYTYNQNDKEVRFYNKSKFFFQATVGIPATQMLGSELGFLLFDECESIPEDAVTKLKSRVRKLNASRVVRYYANPMPNGHWFSEWFHEKPRQGYRLVQAPTHENYYLPADYIAELEAMYPPGSVGRRRYLDGELGVPLEGAVYPEFSPHIHIVEEMPDNVIGYINGLDLGHNNPTCWLSAAVTDDDELIICGEHYAAKMLLADHAECIKEVYLGGPCFADHDAQDRAELEELGVDTVPAHKEVMMGIDTVRGRLVRGTLKILKGACSNLVREFGSYIWHATLEKPIKLNDHAQDALRYLCTGYDYAIEDVNLIQEVYA